MADAFQVNLLKENGVNAWNEWRKENPKIRPDLSDALLTNAPLSEVDLSFSNLSRANLANAYLNESDLHRADLNNADLTGTVLDGANLMDADLTDAQLKWAYLVDTRLEGALLVACDFTEATLIQTDFNDCIMIGCRFEGVDLSECKGLNNAKHSGPSTIGMDTIYLSNGNIPEDFLRGAGVPEPFIVNMKALVAAMSPIEFYSCFISYSSKDQGFAEQLHADLRSKNVRCWFAPEDLKIGDRLRPAFDEAIRVYDTLMVLLSENSVSSPWVEKEVETAFEKERRDPEKRKKVLFPIMLDDAVMETNEAWAADIRRTRHIGDFRDWKNHDSYKKAFERLLRDLKA